MTGTTIAQAIPIAITPILTRIYTPEEFGSFALYMALVGLLGVAATGKYELAIMLPESDKDADILVILSLWLAVLFSLLSFVLIFAFNEKIANLLGSTNIQPWLYTVPLGVLLTGGYNALNYWLNRHKRYLRMSKNRVLQSTTASSFSIFIGWLNSGAGGLIVGQLIGQLVTTLLLLKTFIFRKNKSNHITLDIQQVKKVAFRYKNHPQHLLLAHWVGTVGMQSPVFIISSVFGSTITGFYALAYKMVSMPSLLIANAIGDVYRQEATTMYWEKGEFRSLFIATLHNTTKLAVIPFIILYAIAPDLFSLVFGESWGIAGEYARILIIASFFQFIFTPIDKGALIVGATTYILIWHLLRFFLFVSLAVINYFQDLSIEVILWSVTLINIFIQVLDGVVGYILSGKKA